MISFNQMLEEVMKFYDITNISEDNSDEYHDFLESMIENHGAAYIIGKTVYKAKPKQKYAEVLETIIKAERNSNLPINLVDCLYKYEILPEIYGNNKYR